MSNQEHSVGEQARLLRHSILERHGYASNADVPGAGQPGALQEAAARATINAHWGLGSELPIIGWIVVLVQRALRIGLRWYINPIVDQQTAFNEAVVRALYELETQNEQLLASRDRDHREAPPR